jgi:CubicO group peptidase (beta-lactamase class C family)
MDRVRANLDGLIARSRVPGLQYMTLDRDRTLFEFTGGWADIRHRVPMTGDTTLMAYSMSKTITAVAVLQLVAAGKAALDDPIDRYHPTPYGPGITVRHLLAHLSGIPNPLPLRWVHALAQHTGFDERAALAAELRAHPRAASAPGARYRYSNIGYWLLGSVVERASGQSFASYVADRVFAPLEIPPAALAYAIPDPKGHAHGYLEKYSFLNLAKRLLIDRQFIGDYEGAWLRIEPHYLNGPAFGGLVGTARGFGAFLRDQLRPRSVLFDNPVRELLYSPQRTLTGRVVPMGLGWHLGDLNGIPFFYKEGGGGGFHCEMRVYRVSRIATIVMTNATGFDVKRFLHSQDREFLR